MRRRPFRLPAAWGALIVLIGLGFTALVLRYDHQEAADSQMLVASEVADVIAGSLRSDIYEFYTPTVAGEGLVEATLSESRSLGVSQSDLLDQGFAAFTGPVVEYLGPALLDYQLAPNGIVTYSARPVENAAAIGHNVLVDDARREQALATVAARTPIVAGPLDLVQGGRGVIIRQAIFTPGLAPFEDRFVAATGDSTPYPWLAQVPDDFWGFSTTVIDLDRLLVDVDARGLNEGEFALQAVSADGEATAPFWGSADLVAPDIDRIQRVIELPDGSAWLLTVAIGQASLGHLWPLLTVGLIATTLVVAIAAFAYRSQRRARIGYLFSEGLAEQTTAAEICRYTAGYLADTLPRASGSLHIPGTDVLRFGSDASTGEQRTWIISLSDEVEAELEIADPHPSDAQAVVELIRRNLASSLAVARRNDELHRQSRIDQLTEVFNRRQFQPSFEELAEAARRRRCWLAVGVTDIDDFKGINDTYGHLFGDETLKELGRALGDAVRGDDSVFRFGGDEFVVLALVESEADALPLFERVRLTANEALSHICPGDREVTISIGYVTCAGDAPEPMNELLAKADQALYRAKSAGRDRVEDWSSLGSTTGPVPMG